MKKRKEFEYTDYPIGEFKIIKDFLPPPEELVLVEDTVKITLSLDRESVDYFKKEAKRNHTRYQKMIRNLLNQYVTRHKARNK